MSRLGGANLDRAEKQRGPAWCRALTALRAVSLSLLCVPLFACSELSSKERVNAAVRPVPSTSASARASAAQETKPETRAATPERAAEPPLESSMKGWELYGWVEAEGLRFVLTIATNYAKGCDEVRATAPAASNAPRFEASSLGEVKTLLSRVPAQDTIFWLGNPCGLRTPAPEVLSELALLAGESRFIVKE